MLTNALVNKIQMIRLEYILPSANLKKTKIMKDNKVEIMANAEILSELYPDNELAIQYMNLKLTNNLDEKVALAERVIELLG